MSNEKIQEYLRNIGIILAIIGGVLAAMQSVESIYYALGALAVSSTLGLTTPEALTSGLSAITGLLAGGLAIALTWSAVLAIQSADRKYGLRIIVFAAIPIAFGLVVLIVSGFMLQNVSSTSADYTINTMYMHIATEGLGNIFECSSLAVVGGVLILLSTSKKLKRAGESQQAENVDQ